MKGCTSFVIAHRLSTIRNADKIVLIDKGIVTESGTHRELMSHNGLYRKLNDMQFEFGTLHNHQLWKRRRKKWFIRISLLAITRRVPSRRLV